MHASAITLVGEEVRLLLLLLSTSMTATISLLFLGCRFKDEVDVGPVQAKFGRVATVHLDITVWDYLFNETGYFFDYCILYGLDLVHD